MTRQLLLYLLLSTLFVIAAAGGLAAYNAKISVYLLHDQKMQTNAESLLALLHYELGDSDNKNSTQLFSRQHDEGDDEDESEDVLDELAEMASNIRTQQQLTANYRITFGGKTLFTTPEIQHIARCEHGLSNVLRSLDEHSEQWRCFRRTQPLTGSAHELTVELFEPLQQRNDEITSLLLSIFIPILLLPIVVLPATYWAIKQGLKSLRHLSSEVARRSATQLQRIDRKHQPEELLTVVDSVNGLLSSLDEKIKKEKRFTDDAAHELRTPLTSIKMLTQLIQRDNDNPKLHANLNNLIMSVTHGSDLVDQLLVFARLQNNQTLTKTTVNLVELIHTSFGILSSAIIAKNITIELLEQSANPTIDANEAAMSLLINNLFSNAIKFSPTDGTVTVRLNDFEMRVEDQGPGILEAEQQRIFDRFYRASTAKNHHGSGLGLAIVKWVSDTHGFDIHVESSATPPGAVFVLRFE